jgi:hypothetical protein
MLMRTVSCLAVAGLLVCLGLVGCSESPNRVMSSEPDQMISGTGLSTGLVGSQDNDNSVDGYFYPDYFYTEDEPSEPQIGDTYYPPDDDGDGGGDLYTLYGRSPK